MIENDQPARKYDYMNGRGKNLLSIFGQTAIGLFESEDEINKSPQQTFAIPRVGDIKYADWNGDNVIDNFDVHRIGNGDVPNAVYGFGFSATWKKFQLWRFLSGHHRCRTHHRRLTVSFLSITVPAQIAVTCLPLPAIVGRSITHGRMPFYPRLAYGNSKNINNAQVSTWWLKDIDFIRLKTLDMGYSFPKKILPKWGVKNIRAYIMQ